MGREPEIIEGQFDVAAGSVKAGPETIKKPGILLPTVVALLCGLGWAQSEDQLTDPGLRYTLGIALVFMWPIWRAIQLAIWSAQCKVSDRDADRLAERFPTRAQRRSKV